MINTYQFRGRLLLHGSDIISKLASSASFDIWLRSLTDPQLEYLFKCFENDIYSKDADGTEIKVNETDLGKTIKLFCTDFGLL